MRGWVVLPGEAEARPTDWYRLYNSVDAARAELVQSPDLVCVQRSVHDKRSIVEVWL